MGKEAYPEQLTSTGETDEEVVQEVLAKWSASDTPDSEDKIGTGAIKDDAGKPSVFQGVINYFPRALWGVAEISTFGANKYAWKGWEGVEDGYNRYQDAKYRHALKLAMGEEIDDDSHLMHLKHEAWGALAVLELYLRQKEAENGTD